MQEHPLIELYVSVGDEQQNASVEQMLSSVDLDDVVVRTLREADVTRQVMLTLLITDDEGIRDMNKQYRDQNTSTDVLSFPLLEQPLVRAPADQLWHSPEENGAPNPGQQTPVFVNPPGTVMNLGDIVMSWPTIVRQALEAGHSSRYELLYLLSHGVLHLIGYDDHTEAGYQAMVRIQRAVLAGFDPKA
ncbi:MAG TPA: rRNA maturation RNase YbeY [Ktedonobacteraceae bacterium]|jgi:probable rRNA maturation factor|nr:rRNA maturation RNase YbeY [Ktedonobacteraceae bacterium]